MESQKQQDADKRSLGKRGLFVLLFGIAFGIVQALLNLVAIVQFLFLRMNLIDSCSGPAGRCWFGLRMPRGFSAALLTRCHSHGKVGRTVGDPV
jgi:hypothetical protein